MRRPDPTDRVLPAGHGLRRWLALAALGAALGAARPAAPGFLAGPVLAPGVRVSDRLAAGEHRIYPVALRAGEILHVLVTEEGGDVILRLSGPGGAPIAHVDGPRDPKEDEELAAVAPRGGTYRLEIAASQPGAPPGRYLLRVVDRRPAGERDRLLARAVALTQTANDEMGMGADAQRQLTDRETSLALWRELGERRRMAEALLQIGELHGKLRRNELAARHLHEAVAGFRAAGDRRGLLEALNEAGKVDIRLLRAEEARGHFVEALAPGDPSADPRLKANLEGNLGQALCALGRPAEAMRWLREARALAHSLNDAEIEARLLVNLGLAHADLSERQQALARYREALAIAQRERLATVEAAAWHGLGESHEALGEWKEALDEHQRALSLFRQLDDREREAQSLNSLGWVERRLGRYEEAIRDSSQAIALGRTLGEPSALDAAALASINLAFLHLARREPAAALAAAEEARRLAPAESGAQVTAWHALGAARRALGDLPGAVAALDRALSASRARGDPAIEADAQLHLAEAARDRGDLDAADRLATKALDTIESLRARVAAEGLRTSFGASRQGFYELAIDVLMELDAARPHQGFAARALGVAERARARGLLDLLAEADAAPRVRGEPELAAREERAREAVSSAESLRHELLRALPKPAASELAAAKRAVDRAEAAYEKVEAELADRSPSYASLHEIRPLSTEDIARQVLDPDTLLLEFALGESRSYLWAFGGGTLTAYALPPRQVIERAARRVYELVTARNLAPEGETPAALRARIDRADGELPQAAAALSRLLLAPVAERLGRRRLAIVADGFLQYIPFAALPEPGPAGLPLVAGHELASLPSASVLAVLRREVSHRPRAPHTLAVLADPVFSRDDPRLLNRSFLARSIGLFGGLRGAAGGDPETATYSRLLFSGKEAERIAALVPAADRLVALGLDASRERVLSGELGRYRLVHLATHTLVEESNPRLSGLVLSMVDGRGRRVNGFLRLADIYDLDLDADLVVLSACRTALGQEVRGEGLIGLTRGFMHAGAARVVASLWSVDDRLTADFMVRFYRSMLVDHRAPAAALREAQLGMARERGWGRPYDWAAFSLQGEWR